MEQKILIFKLFFIFSFCLLINNSLLSKVLIEGKAKVTDGDTIKIEKNTVRLHGIDAPETKQTCKFKKMDWNCGLESKIFLLNLINNQTVTCNVTDIDKYKRYVAICFINNQNINQIMVRSGWAIAYRYYSKDYIEDEAIAKKNNSGIWRGEFEEPYLYRKRNK